MKKIGFFLSLLVSMMTVMVASAATASLSNGKLVLDFQGDWATIENGNGNITVVNAQGAYVTSVTGDPEYLFPDGLQDFVVLAYDLASSNLAAGQYTVKVADGAILGHKTDPWAFNLSSIGALELPLTVTGEEGSVDPGTETPGTDEPGTEQPGTEEPEQPEVDVVVDFLISSSLSAITDKMQVAKVTVDRPYYQIYWNVRCATDPDFYFGGGFGGATAAGTYTIVAATPSAEPVELNSGRVYTFEFQTCEFGWDAPKTVATFSVNGAGAAAEQFSDIVITDIDCAPNSLGEYPFKSNYTFTFSAPVKDVKAFVPLGMDGSGNFGVTSADSEGLKWKVNVSSMANEEGSFELHIQARDAATGLRLLGTYHLDNSFIYTIHVSNSNPDDSGEEPELPSEEVEVATLTIGNEVIVLSENTPVELESYPEGAVFTITLADEAVKKVSYEIVDKTANSIYKSISDLTQGEEGKWTAVMPRTYELAAGHEYAVHVVARNGYSSFTSQILFEYNFLVNGTADVAVYSNVTLVGVTPSANTIITEETPTVVITFSEAIASLSAKAITGQMSSMNIPAANISTGDNIIWNIRIPKGAIVDGSLSLDIVAIDYNGNRVTDPENGVGSPENCYLNFGWAATIGLPTPDLAEDGTTLDELESLHFTYSGIGLNVDNATATWNQITISRNGEVLDITIAESMFDVTGDASVGGTELTLTLPEPIRVSGVYTITVPAYAFMLGHDQANFYSGACEFTVTVDVPTGIQQVAAQQNGVVYRLDGTQAANMNSGLYIVGGQKVMIK